jgi:hypothetical protein
VTDIRIKVPTMGTIHIRRSFGEIRSEGSVSRLNHAVRFIGLDRKEVYRVTVGQPALMGVPFSRYDTVHAALSFFESENDALGGDWRVMTTVPVGKARVIRHVYRVFDDGHGGSDCTRGRIRRATLRCLRGIDEDPASCLMRTITENDIGEDFGTLDSPCFNPWEGWGTCPIRDVTSSVASDQRYGSRWISHTIWVFGEIASPETLRGLKNGGACW